MNFIIRKFFNAYHGEESSVLLLFIFGLCLGVFLASFDLGSTVLFLDVFDSENLPKAFMLSGVLGLVLTIAYSYLHLRISFAKLAGIFILLLSGTYLFLYYQYEIYQSPGIVELAFILVVPSGIIIVMIFNGLLNALFDIGQLKRVSTTIDLGIVSAAAGFLFSAEWIKNYFDLQTSQFMVIGAVSGFIALIILTIIIFQFERLNELQVSAQYVGYNNKYKRLLKDRYFVLLSLFVMCAAITLIFVDFYFFSVVHEQYAVADESADEMLRFLSLFMGAVIVSAFAIHAFVSRWAIQQYGMKAALLILPTLLFLGMGIAFGVGFYFGHTIASDTFFLFFIVIIACKLVGNVLKTGLQVPVFKFYFLPINSLLRFDLQSKVEGTVSAFSFVLGGGVLLAIAEIEQFDFLYYPFLIAIFVALWVIAAFKINSVYRELLKQSLDKQQDLIQHEKRLSESYLEQLVTGIFDQDREKMPRYMNVLNILDPVTYKKVLVKLLDVEDTYVQEMALRQASDLCLLNAIPVLEKIMESKYYPVLRTADLILNVYNKLRGAEFRLEKIKYIEQLTLSKLTDERIFGALLTAYAAEEMKGKLLNKLFRDPNMEVRYHTVTAAAGSDNLDLHHNLIEKLNSPAYSNAAVSAIVATGEQLFHMLETAFFLLGQDQKTQLRIVQIYGRVGSERAVELLLKKLNYPNQNVMAEVLEALSKCGHTLDDAESLQIRTELDEVCNTAIWNMSALLDLQRIGCSELLSNALEKEIQTNYENIFRLLALIYDPKSVELVKKNINSGDVEEAEFASELLDVFVSDEIKPMLIPILSTTNYAEKVQRLKFRFPTEPMKKHEVLVNLVQRDYKWVNRWTKACALRELTETKHSDDKAVFAANIVNPDSILRETASEAIYNFYKEDLDGYYLRFKDQSRYIMTSETIHKIIEERTREKQEMPVMKFDIIAFLDTVPDFEKISGLVLSEIAKNMEVLKFKEGEVIETYDNVRLMHYYVIFSGSLSLYTDEIHFEDYTKNQFLHNLDWINKKMPNIELRAKEDIVLFRIKQQDFNELMSFNDEIPRSILSKAGIKIQQKKPEMMLT
ncbi:hypothetical protein FNH22_14620 [Fulvivirga sp. M361]|uniref:MFS transporter n=1 Tax=Fulvivirga sp. M361 TaxID=2594266 RepID=UPI00117BC1BD|nr:MFS transporter [Fulvivirga sp. M361]TRX58289.1 hypothetical protein FNH22_14620 [Fulvivirga sp. M361]